MSTDIYKNALDAAFLEMEALKEQERGIAARKAQVRQTINALMPMVFPTPPDIDSMTLPNALRLILRSAGRPMTARDFKTRLEDLGFNISKYENPMANIMTAMNRMVESDEMYWIKDEDDGKKKGVAGPELKQLPTAPLSSLLYAKNDEEGEETAESEETK